MLIFVVFLALAIGYVFLIKGRINHKDLSAFQGWYYAHRGLYSTGVPENSMAAFRAAKEKGYGIELDVHLMADGNLAVIHDSSLKRITGQDVLIEDLTASDLENYRLAGTEEKIPLFSQVLDLYAGSAPLIVELKAVGANYAALSAATCNMLDSYNGAYCVESFDPRCVAWFRKHRKDVIRGQLTENFFRSKSNLPWFIKFALKHHLLNIASRPDFVACRFEDRKTISNFLCRYLWGMQGVTWTIRTKEDFDIAVREDWIPIFENFIP